METKQHALDDEWMNNEIQEEFKGYFETKDNENTNDLKIWDTVKTVFRGKLVAIKLYCKEQEKSQINNLILLIKKAEKNKQISK